MKILRIINSLETGGAERSIVGNVPIHIANGYEMDVLLLNGKETPFKKELVAKGVTVFSLGTNTNIYNPFLIFKIIPYLHKYDLIHVHLFPAFYWVVFAKWFSFSKVKLVFTEHSTSNRRMEKPIFRWIERIIYAPFNKVICISDATEKNLKKHLKNKINSCVVYNGVDLASVQKEAENIIEEIKPNTKDNFLLMQVAGFRPEKDQDTLIRSLIYLPDNYTVAFIGTGTRLEICKKLVEELRLEHRVQFLGIKNNIGSYLAQADVVVVSSHWEGFGRAAVEGMAVGKPVIGSNIPGLSDVIGNAYLLFELSNEKELTNLILKLNNDSNFYKQMSEYCLEQTKQFDISKMIEGYEEVYRSLDERL
jgi:glycosyltransferase involved in cell wall biosynthesis